MTKMTDINEDKDTIKEGQPVSQNVDDEKSF